MTDERIKQFEIRHERLKTLSDDELKDHFGICAIKSLIPSSTWHAHTHRLLSNVPFC